ncbi:MAG: MTH938/NDUFAF3 family protein [Candidatus Bipolaricaulota bacterium]|nr:MTH938/NDUFAF3 family protein [Candidatus Bipolaricaulota bacterium]
MILTDYRFGRIKVNASYYTDDLIVFEDEILSPWIRRKGHHLFVEDLQWIIECRPVIVIIGTGAFGRLAVPRETSEALLEKGIKLLSFNTAAAAEEYNTRAARGERVAACLHLTC